MKNIAKRLEDELTYLAEIADTHPTAGQEFYRNYDLLKDIQEERDVLWHIVLLTRALGFYVTDENSSVTHKELCTMVKELVGGREEVNS